MLEQAIQYQRLGYDVCLLKPQTKRLAFKQGLRPFVQSELRYWFRRRRFNLGILLGDVVVIDVDDDPAISWVQEHGLDNTPMIAASPHGLHFYHRFQESIRTQIKYLGLPLDIKATGYIVAPPSGLDSGESYTWLEGPVSKEQLPFVNIPQDNHDLVPTTLHVNSFDWLAQPTQEGSIRNPRAYCLKIPSVQGQNGSKALMRCCYICLSNGMISSETFEFLFREWNPLQAVPEWSEKELWHAIQNAVKNLGSSSEKTDVC